MKNNNYKTPALQAERLERALSYVEELIAQRQWDRALTFISENQEPLCRGQESKKALFWRQSARAHAALLDLPTALRYARRAETVLMREGETLELARVYLTLGGILRDMGQVIEAERSFRDAESIFRRSDDYDGRANALNRLAQLCFMNSDMSQAALLLTEALELAQRHNDTKRLAYLYGNLGRVQSFAGESVKAIDNLELNIELSTELNDEVEVGKARLSLGYELLRLTRTTEASEQLQIAEEIIKRLGMRREEVIHAVYQAELEVKRGQLDSARERLLSVLAQADRFAHDGDLAGRVRRSLAELSLAEGKLTRAVKFADEALEVFTSLKQPFDEGALYRIKAEALYRQDKTDESRKMFECCLEKLENTQATFELAVALEWVGKTTLFSNNKRLACLFRAQELLIRRGDPTARVRIDKLIANAAEFGVDYEPATSKTSAMQGAKTLAGSKNQPGDFLTENPIMKKCLRQLEMLRHSDLPILFTGETGVGKGHLARYYHQLARPGAPFVAINVTNVPETLLEAELFGHARGAYTDAVSDTQGLLSAANGGTLFLDEIGEMPHSLQVRLLNVIEEKRFRPVGSVKEIEVDFVLVTATNRDLKEMVNQGKFRRDLYHRLDGFVIEIPALRERPEDIPLLLEVYLRRHGLLKEGEKPEKEMLRTFMSYNWPGNVRELENMVKRMKALSGLALEGSLVELVRPSMQLEQEEVLAGLNHRVERFEKKLICEALLSANWNRSEAARHLDLHESTLRAKIKRFGLVQPGARMIG